MQLISNWNVKGKTALSVRWDEVANSDPSTRSGVGKGNGLQSNVWRATCEWSEGGQHGSTHEMERLKFIAK